MNTTSGAALARQLGTSVPRVTRAARRLGIKPCSANGRLALDPEEVSRIRAELGVTPHVPGLSAVEAKVLAALRSAPFGLVSARAVASRAGVSPAAASRALARLKRRGLVRRDEEMVAAGRARRIWVWRAALANPRFSSLDPHLDQIEPTGDRQQCRSRRVPARLRHLFWNTAPGQLEVASAGPYIARRLLQTMDIQGLAWGAQTLSPEDWRQGAKARGLDPAVRSLAENLAEEAS